MARRCISITFRLRRARASRGSWRCGSSLSYSTTFGVEGGYYACVGHADVA